MLNHPATYDLVEKSAFWQPGVNSEGTAVPGCGAVRVTGSSTGFGFSVARPTEDGEHVWIACPHGLAASGYGPCAADGVMYALYDSDDGTPAVEETWGAGAGTYKLKKGKAGFRIVGTPDTTNHIVPVVRASGATALDLFGTLPQNGFTTIVIEGNTYISVYLGCGLEFDDDGAIQIDAATLVGDRATTALTTGEAPCGIAFDKEIDHTVPITYVTDVFISYPAPGQFRLNKVRQTITDRYNAAHVLVDRTYADPVADSYTVDVCDLLTCCEYDPLDVSYGADPIYGDAPLEVDFTVTVTGGSSDYSYFWDFDDGDTSTAQNPTHTFTDPGVYEVTITVTDEVCGMTETYTIYIYVSEPCACDVCEEEGFPLRYGFTLSGGTEDFAGANGAWTVYHTVDCSWFGFNDNGWSVSFVINSDQTRDIVFVGPDLQSIVYETDAIPGCCDTITPSEITFTNAVGTGDEPTFNTPGIQPLDGCEPCPPETGGTVSCAECGRALNATLTATLSGGEGTMSLTWNSGAMQWPGSKALGCGLTLYLAFSLDCVLFYSCDGANFAPAVNFFPSTSCGPPFTMSTFVMDTNNPGIGCNNECGILTASISE